MDDADPISQFFPDHEDNILYTVLGITPDATTADINKAYRKSALLHHPDKHASASEAKREQESTVFQQVGFAYAVLKDEARRKSYDDTGRTNEASFLEEGESKGWDAYFEEVFEQVTRGKMDEMKDAYQGTEEEKADLYAAYELHDGSLPDMMTEVVFSSSSDETRFIALINAALAAGTLESTDLWTKTSTDTKAIKKRAVAEKREAREAEEHAKALGVWDEFYGSGKATDKKVRKSKLKGKAVDAEDDEGDLEGLKALMLRRKQGGEQRFESLIAGLEAKAKAPPSGAKGKKGKKADENAAPADIDDAAFEKLQSEMSERAAESKRLKAEEAASKKRPGAEGAGNAGKKRRGGK